MDWVGELARGRPVWGGQRGTLKWAAGCLVREVPGGGKPLWVELLLLGGSSAVLNITSYCAGWGEERWRAVDLPIGSQSLFLFQAWELKVVGQT